MRQLSHVLALVSEMPECAGVRVRG